MKEKVKRASFLLPIEVYNELMATCHKSIPKLSPNVIASRGIKLALEALEKEDEITRKEIVKICAAGYRVPANDLYGGSHKREIVRARYAAIRAMWILKPNITSPQLGKTIGKDHTTVLRALNRVTNNPPTL